MTIPREEVEKELTFLGFLIMQNKLKQATIKALTELNESDIRTIMATGDNMLTALSVGRKCGII
jgi:cation-transporting ATPase 13A2